MDLKKAAVDFNRTLNPSIAPVSAGNTKGSLAQLEQNKNSEFVQALNKTQDFELKKSTGGLPPTAVGAALKFSNHAIDRMRTRGIAFSPQDMGKLQDAVNRAASKGSKDSLILMNDSAVIVNIKSGTVVTVMDKTALKENVFTNIDSTIVM